MTSAPSQARSCVQVGPACTWVKARILTPSSAFIMSSQTTYWRRGPALRLLFLHDALRVQIADAATRGTGIFGNHCVDEGRLARFQGLARCAAKLIRGGSVDALATERFHHLLVA